MSVTVYRNPTHKGHYINYGSNHLPNVQAGDIQILRNTATFVCQENQDVKENWTNSNVFFILHIIPHTTTLLCTHSLEEQSSKEAGTLWVGTY
jgi:hypothetical protein